MSIAVITGSGGLIGSEAARFCAGKGLDVVGIDNDMRAQLFGAEASTQKTWNELERKLLAYKHLDIDIRDVDAIGRVFSKFGHNITLVIHAAGQPSHDWAAREPITDFNINALGTLNLLEAARKHCPNACFIYCSTNKVYGDAVNRLPLVELETRWELPASHDFGEHGIDETMSIDASMHSLFGVSKCAADLLVQEYGRYFGMNTACFRAGCITGPGHAGAELHGFLAYLIKCAVTNQEYTIFGHQGKQVRDNLHVADLINAFWLFFENPRPAAVFNIGGGRFANCSVIEAIGMIENLTQQHLKRKFHDTPRPGDHVWWISDTRRFESCYPTWRRTRDIRSTMEEIHAVCAARIQGR